MPNGKCRMPDAIWIMPNAECQMPNAIWKMANGFCKKFALVLSISIGVLISSPNSTNAQIVPDARAILEPVLDPLYTRLTFDLKMRRLSDRWEYWANTTLRIESTDLAPTGGWNPAIHTLTFVLDSSDLPLVPYTPGSMLGYYVDAQIVGGDIIVNVIGPDSVTEAVSMLNPDSIRIGRFEVTSNDASYVPEILAFTTPLTYYQANAFKIDHDSVTGNGSERNVWFLKNDNPPLETDYVQLAPPPDICDAHFNFYGSYVGDLTVMLGFDVDDEHCYEGYIIERALVDRRDINTLNFVGRPQLVYTAEPRLLSCLCLVPQVHDSLFDVVDYRREMYAYRLIGKHLPFYGDTLEYIDTIFIRIPNAIISNARILENPFTDQTTIRFNIDDRLKLTARVYDLGGRLVGTLETAEGVPVVDMEYPIGIDYRIIFKAPDIASQGLYNIVLVATPMNDMSITEQSRVVIKAQMLR